MTATERLRELLDERGVEWSAQDRFTRDVETRWLFPASSAQFTEYEDGMTIMVISGAEWTPEQAIAATLGRGECQFKTVKRFIDARRDRADMCECDRCGYRCARGFIQDERFKYCPNCGAKVVGDVLRTE